MKRKITFILFVIYFIVLMLCIKPTLSLYDTVGIDVSRYQGEIDWQEFASQNISFAFIKATEGSNHVDKCFADNWQNIADTEIYASPYHFLSYDSSGITQAENFISTVGKHSGMLPPVVDVEFYGDYYKNPPSAEKVQVILNDFLYELERFYGVKPIIYTTYKTYSLYIKDKYDAYPLWIRNIYFNPLFLGVSDWQFWQYSDSGILSGHQGQAIDLNVFRGKKAELEKLLIK